MSIICGRDYSSTSFYNGDCAFLGIGLPSCNDSLLSQIDINNGVSYLTQCDDADGACFRVGVCHNHCTQNGWNRNNIVSCCDGTQNDPTQCSPDWCPGSLTCSATLQQFCTQNNGENITTPQCEAICSNPLNDQIKTWCDLASINYCNVPANEGLPYCGCINSSNGTKLACFDPNCTSLGYRTRNVQSDLNTCASGGVTICTQAITCRDSGSCQIDNNKFNSICGSNNNSSSSSSSSTTNQLFTSLWFWLFIVLVVIVIIAVIYF